MCLKIIINISLLKLTNTFWKNININTIKHLNNLRKKNCLLSDILLNIKGINNIKIMTIILNTKTRKLSIGNNIHRVGIKSIEIIIPKITLKQIKV